MQPSQPNSMITCGMCRNTWKPMMPCKHSCGNRPANTACKCHPHTTQPCSMWCSGVQHGLKAQVPLYTRNPNTNARYAAPLRAFVAVNCCAICRQKAHERAGGWCNPGDMHLHAHPKNRHVCIDTLFMCVNVNPPFAWQQHALVCVCSCMQCCLSRTANRLTPDLPIARPPPAKTAVFGSGSVLQASDDTASYQATLQTPTFPPATHTMQMFGWQTSQTTFNNPTPPATC